jgi:twitching motility protein PilJ
MASGTDYAQEYGQAEKAYMQGNYQEAAAICNRLIDDFPDDPSLRLLRGHIYCYGLQQYDVAREQYELVLSLTSERDFLNYANNGLEYANQFTSASDVAPTSGSPDAFDDDYHLDETDDLNNAPTFENWQQELDRGDHPEQFDLASLDFDEDMGDDFPSQGSASPFGRPLGSSSPESGATTPPTVNANQDPFAFTAPLADDTVAFDDPELDDISDFELSANIFGGGNVDDISEDFFDDVPGDDTNMTFVMPPTERFEESAYEEHSEPFQQQSEFDADFSDEEIEAFPFNHEGMAQPYNSSYPVFEDETLLMGSGEHEDTFATEGGEFGYVNPGGTESIHSFAEDDDLHEDQTFELPYAQNGFNSQEDFNFDNFDDTFGHETFAMDEVTASDSGTYASGSGKSPSARDGFLEEFDVFGDDLGSIPDFSLGVQEDVSHERVNETDFDVLSNSSAMPGATGRLGLNDTGEDLGGTASQNLIASVRGTTFRDIVRAVVMRCLASIAPPTKFLSLIKPKTATLNRLLALNKAFSLLLKMPRLSKNTCLRA